MFLSIKITLAVILRTINLTSGNVNIPSDLHFGVATSAYQIEGAWNTEGKGPSYLDYVIHKYPKVIKDLTNGDDSCLSYYKTEEDVELLKNLGVTFYRFSISWSRIFPYGFTNSTNPLGVAYYNNLIDALKNKQIEPFVTMQHFDLPLNIHKVGGFENNEIVKYFSDYARFLYKTFGDRVKFWTTFNEVLQMCTIGILNHESGGYICIRNMLKAHAEAYHIYYDEFANEQKGKIGIILKSDWFEPYTTEFQHVVAAERKRQFEIGIFANPIFSKSGDYPSIVKEYVEDICKRQNTSLRLPPLSKEEVERIKGTADFFALNHYSTFLVKNRTKVSLQKYTRDNDMKVYTFQSPNWYGSKQLEWNKVLPWGLKNILIWLKQQYGDLEFYITENGYADDNGLNDTERIDFHKQYIKAMIEAMEIDKVKVKLYSIWSFLDNFEWVHGYEVTFGLYQVNFSDPNRTRIPKESVSYFRKVFRERILFDN